MKNIVAEANTLGSAINNWTKIAAVILFIVGGAYLTYYQIQSNTAANARQDTEVKDILEMMQREFQLWGDRSDKRYKRAMEEAAELQGNQKALWKEVTALKVEFANNLLAKPITNTGPASTENLDILFTVADNDLSDIVDLDVTDYSTLSGDLQTKMIAFINMVNSL